MPLQLKPPIQFAVAEEQKELWLLIADKSRLISEHWKVKKLHTDGVHEAVRHRLLQ